MLKTFCFTDQNVKSSAFYMDQGCDHKGLWLPNLSSSMTGISFPLKQTVWPHSQRDNSFGAESNHLAETTPPGSISLQPRLTGIQMKCFISSGHRVHVGDWRRAVSIFTFSGFIFHSEQGDWSLISLVFTSQPDTQSWRKRKNKLIHVLKLTGLLWSAAFSGSLFISSWTETGGCTEVLRYLGNLLNVFYTITNCFTIKITMILCHPAHENTTLSSRRGHVLRQMLQQKHFVWESIM